MQLPTQNLNMQSLIQTFNSSLDNKQLHKQMLWDLDYKIKPCEFFNLTNDHILDIAVDLHPFDIYECDTFISKINEVHHFHEVIQGLQNNHDKLYQAYLAAFIKDMYLIHKMLSEAPYQLEYA